MHIRPRSEDIEYTRDPFIFLCRVWAHLLNLEAYDACDVVASLIKSFNEERAA